MTAIELGQMEALQRECSRNLSRARNTVPFLPGKGIM